MNDEIKEYVTVVSRYHFADRREKLEKVFFDVKKAKEYCLKMEKEGKLIGCNLHWRTVPLEDKKPLLFTPGELESIALAYDWLMKENSQDSDEIEKEWAPIWEKMEKSRSVILGGK